MNKPQVQKLIYKITNIENELCYIGQTYSEIKNGEEIGHIKRWKDHVRDSEKDKPSCPRFHNAILMCGKDNFVLDVLLYSSEDEIDDCEKLLISLYGSNKKEYGYNIADGGRGLNPSDENIRVKISLSQGSEDMNIRPYYRFNKHVGYRVMRRENCILKQKYFTSQKNTVEENYKLAKDFLNSLLNKEDYNNIHYNRTNDLPKNIVYYKDKRTKEIRGFAVQIIKDKILYKKNFATGISLEEKYKKALNYKEELQKKLGITT